MLMSLRQMNGERILHRRYRQDGQAGEQSAQRHHAEQAAVADLLGDILGREVGVPETPEVSSLGAAVCAGVGAGFFRDLAEGAEVLSRTARTHAPGADSERYQGLYAGWRQGLDLRAECDAHMANLMAVAMLGRSTAAGEAPAAYRPRVLVTASMDEAALEELRDMGEVTYLPWRENRMVYDGDRKSVV